MCSGLDAGGMDAAVETDAGPWDASAEDAGTPPMDAFILDTGTEEDAGRVDFGSALAVTRTAPTLDRVAVRDTLMLQYVVRGGPDYVELLMDGALLVYLSPPYSYGLDTRGLSEGTHTAEARAVRGGEEAISATLTIEVDRTAPRVIGRSPIGGDADAWLGAPFEVRFSEPVLASTVNGSSIRVAAGVALGVPVTISLEAGDTIASVRMMSTPPLPSVIQIDVGAAITDLAGNAALADSWTFSAPAWGLIGSGPAEVPASAIPVFPFALATDVTGAHPCVSWAVPEPASSTRTDLSIACFDGSAWATLGAPLFGGPDSTPTASAMALDAAGRPIIAWIERTTIAQNAYVARWTGSAWNVLGAIAVTGPNYVQLALDTMDRPVIALGTGNIDVLKWDGTVWVPIGTPVVASSVPISLALGAGDAPVVAWPAAACQVRRWDGSDWVALGSGVVGSSTYSCAQVKVDVGPSGSPSVAATFTSSYYVSYLEVRTWDGASWTGTSPSAYSTQGAVIRMGADGIGVLAYYLPTSLAGPGVHVMRLGPVPAEIGMFTGSSTFDMRLFRGSTPIVLVSDSRELRVYRQNAI